MSDLPPARRRRVAPVVTDPMAPTVTPPAAPARTELPAPQAEAAPQQNVAPVGRPASRRQEPTVQLGTRVRPESDRRLRELAASRGVTIRQVIEDLVDEAWSREVPGPPARF